MDQFRIEYLLLKRVIWSYKTVSFTSDCLVHGSSNDIYSPWFVVIVHHMRVAKTDPAKETMIKINLKKPAYMIELKQYHDQLNRKLKYFIPLILPWERTDPEFIFTWACADRSLVRND